MVEENGIGIAEVAAITADSHKEQLAEAAMDGAGHNPQNQDDELQDEEAGFKQSVTALLLCPVCHETVTDPRQLNCGHFFCYECVELLTVDEIVRCAKCGVNTPESGIRVDELASNLLKLLQQHSKPNPQVQENKNILLAAPVVNGIDHQEETPKAEDDLHAPEEAEAVADEAAAPEAIIADTKDDDSDEQKDGEVNNALVAAEPIEIIEPPVDYQSPEEDSIDDLPPPPLPPRESTPTSGDTTLPLEPTPPPSPPSETVAQETAREPVEHDDATDTVHKIDNTATESTVDGEDEPDRKMKASEIKPSDVAISIEMERQCENCKSANCNCNVNGSLLTPPVSTGSQISVETTSSNSPSDDVEILEMPVRQLKKFVVTESASSVAVASKNRIYATRWTYDEDGTVSTFDGSGKKIKFIHNGGHYNYSGITISKLGFVFALNTSKNRVEEYSGIDGKKKRQFKLDGCRDPQAIAIMPTTGEVLVVDQERNCIIVYPNHKKTDAKPRHIKHELIKEPYDVAAAQDGFYVTCAGTHCVVKFDIEGKVIWSHGNKKDPKRRFKKPQGVCVDESGNTVYVVDRLNHSIFVFSKDGELKGKLVEKVDGQLQNPWYMSVRDGILAVLFSHNIIRTYEFA